MTSGSTHAYYSACHGLATATDLIFIAQVVYLLEHKRLKIHTQQQLKKNGKETEKAKKHGDFGRKMEKSIYVYTHTHTHTFNGPFSGTTQVSRYQKGKTNLDFTEERDSEWQWH